MKKPILVLILILIVVGAILSLLGLGGEYAAEKLFYQATKINAKIALNPDVAPPVMVKTVENHLKKILKKYPKTNTAKMAHITLAEFYSLNKKYDKALATAEDIINTYPKDIPLLSMAQFIKGGAYEKQDQWDVALKEYTILREKYANTQLGVQMPLYIARYYVMKEMRPEADKAYNDAALFYKKLERKNRGKVRGYSAATLLMQSYMALKKYEEVGKVVEDVIDNYSSSIIYTQQLPNVELIYVRILKKPERAIEIYNRVIEKAKDEKLKNYLQKKIEELQTQQKGQKNKGS